MIAFLASLWHTVVNGLAPVVPRVCPYCPDNATPHWICWGSYERYAQGHRGRLRVRRYRCKLTKRTFSLLPHGLLPFHFYRTASILKWLHGLVVEGRSPRKGAEEWGVSRSSLRRLQDSFLRTVPTLRLPGVEGALGPREFLVRLPDRGVDGIASLFQGWKEEEPKLCVVGIYRR